MNCIVDTWSAIIVGKGFIMGWLDIGWGVVKIFPLASCNFFPEQEEKSSPPLSPVNGSGCGGWSPKVAAVVWLRMLKVLGNINKIQDGAVHAEAMDGLYQIWTTLNDVSQPL